MDPEVSVIVSTRNRPEQVVACVEAILSNTGVDFEIVVVDQSDTTASRDAAAGVRTDSRLRWVETHTRGLSISRNVGVGLVRAPVVAFTDDDCRVPADWLTSIAAAFTGDSDLALLFGAVLLRPEDRVEGYGAEFAPTEYRAFRHALPDMRFPWGIGANMAISKRALDRLGAFDPLLGAGAPFFAAEEIDMTIRALSAGLKVAQTPHISVLHLGVRRGDEASRLMRGYGFGLGATFSKHVRLRTPGAARALSQWIALHGERSIRNALRGDRHPGFGLVASVLLGACRSITVPIDARQAIFDGRSRKKGAA
jgi:GT2 family glycosyltransferase